MGYPCQFHPLPFWRVWAQGLHPYRCYPWTPFPCPLSLCHEVIATGVFVASFLVHFNVVDKLAGLVGVIALS
jgi:hypothetical protein